MRAVCDEALAGVGEHPCPHCGLPTVFSMDFTGSFWGSKARGLKSIRPHKLRACLSGCGAVYVDGVQVADLTRMKGT